MNKSITSREKILEVCRNIVSEKGVSAINIRDVSSKCNASVGAIYYYFNSKNDLVNAVVESIWIDIFHSKDESDSTSFIEYIDSLFTKVEKGSIKYQNFLTLHSISITARDRKSGREHMIKFFDHIKQGLLYVLNNDKQVLSNAFTEYFTKEDFIDMILSLSISMMIQNKFETAPLLELIRRSIY